MNFAVVLCSLSCVMMSFGQNLEKFQVCVERLKPTDEDITTIASRVVPETDGAKKLMACAMKEMGLMKGDNTLDVEGAKEAFSPLKNDDEAKYNKVIATFEKCEKETTGKPEMNDELSAMGLVGKCVLEGTAN